MLEVRESLFQISQFVRAGSRSLRCSQDDAPKDKASSSEGMCVRWCAQPHQSSLTVERPPFGGLLTANNVKLDLGQANAALILPSIGQQANAEEAEHHHGPG